MPIRSLTIVILISILALLAGGSAQADDRAKESESWITPDRYEPGFQGILVSDLINSQQLFSRLQAQSDQPVAGSTYTCSSVDDPGCKDATQYWFNALLPICDARVLKDCVTNLSVTDQAGNEVRASFLRYIYPNHINRFLPNDALKIPQHAQPSIWNIPTVPHNGGTEYALIAGLNGATWTNFPKAPENFYAHLLPVQRVVTGWATNTSPNSDGFSFQYPQCIAKSPGTNGEARVGCKGQRDQGIGEAQYRCVLWVDEGSDCYIQRPFPEDISFTLDLRLSSAISGWLHGRLSEPNISIAPGPDGATELSISAKPIEVPIFYAGDLYERLPNLLQQKYQSRGHLSQGGGYGRICCEVEPDPKKRNSTSTPNSFGDDSINELSLWLGEVSDKAVAVPSMWSVRTMAAWELSKSNQCFVNGRELKGLVTTNSTTYSDGPPTFSEDSLNYRVASPHLRHDGQIFKGSYDLVIRSETARCLYGFSNAPLSAEIEVISEDGASSVATSVFGERDGWLYLSAKNFTFSAPVIRAKLTQPKVSDPPSESSKDLIVTPPLTQEVKTKSVNCVKGKKASTKSSSSKKKCSKR
jgi:hypothetical protein